MNAKIGHAVAAYENLEKQKAGIERLEQRLYFAVSLLSPDEFAEYVEVTERMGRYLSRAMESQS